MKAFINSALRNKERENVNQGTGDNIIVADENQPVKQTVGDVRVPQVPLVQNIPSDSNIIIAKEDVPQVKIIEDPIPIIVSPTKKPGLEGSGIMTDDELRAALEQAMAKIRVVGAGGSGNNTIKRLYEIGIHGAQIISINTDAQHLLMTPAHKKVLIGKKLTRGLGAGSNPEIGEAAAKESMSDLAIVLGDSDLIFITCGLGGGTGTGAASVIAQIARDIGALSIGIVTLPFSVEGKKRMENALKGLTKLQKECDTVIVIPNDKLLEIVPELPLNAAFRVADEVLANAVKGITEMITKPGLVNLDFADVRTILGNGGSAMIGLGESTADGSGQARAIEAVEEALSSPLLDVDITNANKAIINVIGGADMTLREAEVICESVADKIHSNAHIIWGAMIDEELPRNAIQAMVVIAGGRVSYLETSPETGEVTIPDIDVDYVSYRE